MSENNATANGLSQLETPGELDVQPEVVTLETNSGQGADSGSAIQIVQSNSLPGNRPVSASDLKVVDTRYVSGANRPVGANSFEIAKIDTLPGHRPIASSNLVNADTSSLPGHRPIASNDIDDPTELMGYLD